MFPQVRGYFSVGLIAQWSNLKWAAGPLRRAARLAEQASPRDQPANATHYRVNLRLGDEERAALLHRYQTGTPAVDLAREYGISRQSVNVLAEEAGLPRRVTRLTQEQQQEIIELYQSGLGLASVGKRVGRSKGTVFGILRRAGIPTRVQNTGQSQISAPRKVDPSQSAYASPAPR